MPSIHIQTIPNGTNIFQFIQSGRIVDKGLSGFDCEDWVQDYQADNRLKASIINFGLAARYLVDDWKGWNNEIIIATDTDGKDVKYGKEHNILYALLNPHNDYEAHKLAGLYQEYKPFLVRVKELIGLGRIGSKLE